jgi:hypothetical protein
LKLQGSWFHGTLAFNFRKRFYRLAVLRNPSARRIFTAPIAFPISQTAYHSLIDI